MNRLIANTLAVASISIFVAAPAPSQTVSAVGRDGGHWVQQVSGTLDNATRLRVSAIGAITVRGDAGSRQVSYRVLRKVKAGSQAEAEQIFKQAQFTAARRGPTATLVLADPSCGRCGFMAEMTIDVPANFQDTVIDTQGGAVDVHNVSGRVNAETAGGEIRMDQIGGGVRAATAGGAIELGAIGGDVVCESAGGSISVGETRGIATLNTGGGAIEVGTVRGDLRAETAGGGISAQHVQGAVVAGTLGGSIKIGYAAGLINADTAGGSIEIAQAARGVRAETAAGHIHLTDVAGRIYAASASGDIRAYLMSSQPLLDSLIETAVGTIVVYLPADIRVAIDAEVDFANGMDRIQSEFGSIEISRVESGLGPGLVRAVGALNGGGPVLRIRNTNGRIQIRRREP